MGPNNGGGGPDKNGGSNGKDREWELFEARFDYAWKYFDFHAKQRTTMFNFFILFAGVVINACMRLIQGESWFALLLVSIPAAIITAFFVFLERRNEELVWVAEGILRVLEEESLFENSEREIKLVRRGWFGCRKKEKLNLPVAIFLREDAEERLNRQSKYQHGKWLPAIQYTILIVFLAFTLMSVFHRQMHPLICWFR